MRRGRELIGRRASSLKDGFGDARSGEVVFMAHCLLNQNTRYLGGAVCPGAVRAAVEGPLAEGVGIVQLPCPEQRVWGGVLKRRFLWLLDHRRAATAGRIGWPVVKIYLRRRYARLARGVVDDIVDYRDSGFRVREIVGVGGSPSCGVTTTLDLAAALRTLSRKRPVTVPSGAAPWVNELVATHTCAGAGMFVAAVTRELDRRDVHVPAREVVLDPPQAADRNQDMSSGTPAD